MHRRPTTDGRATPTPSTQHEKTILDTYRDLNSAATQHEIQALTGHLLTVTTSEKGPPQTTTTAPNTRASTDESRTRLRAYLDTSHRAAIRIHRAWHGGEVADTDR